MVECHGAGGMLGGAGGMLGCWWNAEAFVECQFAGGVLGWLVECYGACGMLRCWWNAMALVECQGWGEGRERCGEEGRLQRA